MALDNKCGEPKDDGSPCERPAGWGTPSDMGPCRDHSEEWQKPRKLNPQTRENILGATQRGTTKKHAAAVGGITEQTLRNWLNWGEEHVQRGWDTPLSDFYLDFQRARGQGAARTLEECSPEFRASASFGYHKTEGRNIGGPDGEPFEVEIHRELREPDQEA